MTTKLITTVIDPNEYASRLSRKIFGRVREEIDKPASNRAIIDTWYAAADLLTETMREMTDEVRANIEKSK